MALCQRCNKTQATVHLLDISPSGEKREHHLCEHCANEEGMVAQQHEPINAILDSFLKQASGMQQMADLSCPDCGMTFREFRSNGVLGCPNDYAVFERYLAPLIERAHEGATHHVGKVPTRQREAPSPETELAKFKHRLKDAVESEDYELAARLRDQIKKQETP